MKPMPCPAPGCESDTRAHCQSPTCNWIKCNRSACSAVANPSRGRGFVTVGDATKAFTFGGLA